MNHTISIHQEKYIEIKLQMFKLEMSAVATPIEVGLKLTKEMFLQIENEKVNM
jgi:hypothetical protein